MKRLLTEIRSCTICEGHLPLGPRPVLSISPESRILIVGQAPGTKVHASGVPWDDASGKELRRWLGVNEEEFYDTKKFGILPMGLCYPGRGRGGDLPPRPECAPLWHGRVLEKTPHIKLTLLIGAYAQKFYLGKTAEKTLTATVINFEQYLPTYFPLVHPSPRNLIWRKKNPWFESDVVPVLREKVYQILSENI
ncbi:uracil-DNA glycosylase family protein [Litoribacter alkaliphilus]|uniref:Uracil-DNA glycosylase family protein n=1 Tax=Litoribacter ruber TaxID=702568 RepID=A0AAP2G494_9BACT|nr:uracil-DNA glycosylase family protein [Litoribacter alkaliphilus]MBS9523806.1 uracil-DNA glycosylase family protein [Litoribacter alkaliphilus]